MMHGTSSVPRELVESINRHGGQIRETWGVPLEEIQQGIRYGVRKVNVDTDIRLAFTAAVRKFLAESPAAIDPRDYLEAARAAVRQEAAAHMRAFGQAGHAGDYAPLPLGEMAARYSRPGRRGMFAPRANPQAGSEPIV